MAYKRTILCLANSRKISGRCIAGKVVRMGTYEGWLRPVSKRDAGELSEEERRYETGSDPKVGDVIQLELLSKKVHPYQRENHLIDDTIYWSRLRVADWAEMLAAVDEVDGPLWQNGSSSSRGLNDRVPIAAAAGLETSLYLVGPLAVEILVQREWEGKRAVRAHFALAGETYQLKVTDPIIEREYLGGPNGSFALPAALLCLSLSEPFEGYAYKLVATVILPPDNQVE